MSSLHAALARTNLVEAHHPGDLSGGAGAVRVSVLNEAEAQAEGGRRVMPEVLPVQVLVEVIGEVSVGRIVVPVVGQSVRASGVARC